MGKDSYRFKIGDFECLAINDGTLAVRNVHLKQLLKQYDMQSEPTMDLTCLFIRTKEHQILIDTGLGVGIGANTGKLINNLQDAGIQYKEIDTIILSHGHGDHIGGITDAEGRIVFPNARYIMCKKEWEFWTSDPELKQLNAEESAKQMLLAAVRKNLLPVKDQLNLIESDTEIVSGIELIITPGHTPGHIVLLISSGTEKLLCTADLIHHPLELTRPDLFSSVDTDPDIAIHTRNQIISQLVTPNVLVFASHFPFPSLGHIVQKEDMWLWNPIEIRE